MIVTLRGTLLETTEDGAVVEAGGLGYAVSLSAAARGRLPALGAEVLLHVVESVAMYGGGVTLYGFPTSEEKKIFLALKENVPGAGAKKALEFLDKAMKSLPDFRRALVDKDVKRLVALFGFTPKTAEKLVAGLRDKVDSLPSLSVDGAGDSGPVEDAIQGLVSLGYREADARDAAQGARQSLPPGSSSQSLIKNALRRLSGRV
jgi:Holliday junction DNA helicase RuvA